jgi:hypothetical protein
MMRQPAFLPIACAAVLAAFASVVPGAVAATLYWDGNDTTANADGGNGTWNTSNTNWDSAATGGANTAWGTGGNVNIANFGGTGGTVTLGSDMGPSGAYPNSINVTAGNYVLDLNSLGLAWRGSGLTISSGATLVIQNGTITLLGNGITVTGTNALTITAKVSGSADFSKGGAGDVTLNNDTNDFTGKLYGQNGAASISLPSRTAVWPVRRGQAAPSKPASTTRWFTQARAIPQTGP